MHCHSCNAKAGPAQCACQVMRSQCKTLAILLMMHKHETDVHQLSSKQVGKGTGVDLYFTPNEVQHPKKHYMQLVHDDLHHLKLLGVCQ